MYFLYDQQIAPAKYILGSYLLLVLSIHFFVQAWRGRRRQLCVHHSPSSIQGEWLAIDDQKNNILASLGLASYLVANWLQKLETKHCAYYVEVISVLMCVFVCVCVCVCVVCYLSLNYL